MLKLKIKTIVIALFLILTGCSKPQMQLEPTVKKIPLIKCDNNFTVKAEEKKYSYIVPKEDFEELIKRYSRCVKACKYYNKILLSK